MSQSFEGAQPQVVRDKHKYRGTKDGALYPPIPEEEEGRQALNIMYDKRVFRGNTHNQQVLKSNLTPAQKEENRIQQEREKKKIEMIKSQLLEFKKSKNTTSPYDLRPGPPARIEVDLTYFLTEQGKTKPKEAEVKLQTDNFQPKPPTPKYIPKKTGIDKITQIEDYDLFNYDEEVQPILNVLLSKSIDQAILEVEEEHEIEQIRQFKYQYHQRKRDDDQEWQSEVKKEIQRIKIKNKNLDIARSKREQQLKTMNKLQCLNIAKNFLSTNFKQSMQFLADKNHWRDTFKDQLNVDFKEWMYASVTQNLENKSKAQTFKDGIADEQITKIGAEKDPIKKRVRFNLEKKEKFRVIESKDKRIVHFLFKPNVPTKESCFARKYKRFIDGTLAEFDTTEKEKFDGFIARLKADELREEEETGKLEVNPVKYEHHPYNNFELSGGIAQICFSTADDPFYKAPVARHYPNVIVFNKNGERVAEAGPDSRKNTQYALNYLDDFRDAALKINDDKKVQIHLSQISEPGTMILLCIRQFDLTGKPQPREGAFDRSWFRLSNEETNQTLDYNLIKNIAIPEEYKEFPEAEDEEAPAPGRNELIYVHGCLILEEGNKWVFESYQHVFESKNYNESNLIDTIGQIYAKSCSDLKDQQDQINDAKNALKKSKEEKAMQQMEIQKKQKAKGKGAKGKVQEETNEEVRREEEKVEEEVYDLDDQASFTRALTNKLSRPFIVGPIQFEGLNLSEDQSSFDYEKERSRVCDEIERSPFMPQQVCIHGYNVLIKKRNLKRRTSLLKHARFLNNLVVTPKDPPVKEPTKDEEEQNEDDDDN